MNKLDILVITNNYLLLQIISFPLHPSVGIFVSASNLLFQDGGHLVVVLRGHHFSCYHLPHTNWQSTVQSRQSYKNTSIQRAIQQEIRWSAATSEGRQAAMGTIVNICRAAGDVSESLNPILNTCIYCGLFGIHHDLGLWRKFFR